MRISTSQNYAYGYDHDCDIQECERHYCNDHRTLWQDCDTAEKEGDDSGRRWWTLREAPCCLAAFRRKKMEAVR